MSGRQVYSLLNIENQNVEPISDGFVVRYKVDEERVALRFEVQVDGLFVIFEGNRGFPVHNDSPIPPATPTRIKEGDRLFLGKKQFRIIASETRSDTKTDFELRDIWSDDYISRRSEKSRIFESPNVNLFSAFTRHGDSRFALFVLFEVGMFIATVIALSVHAWPANVMASASVILWLFAFVITGSLSIYWIWTAPPVWMSRSVSWGFIFGAPFAPHVLVMLASLLLGSRYLGFPSIALFSGDNYSLGNSKTKFILFPNDWYYMTLRPDGRLPAQVTPGVRKYQVSAERLATLLDDLFKVKFETALCRDPLLLSACYQFDANRCRKSLAESHSKCSVQTAGRSWEMKDIPEAARGNIQCLIQTITTSQTADISTAKCEKTIKAAVQKVQQTEGDPTNMLKVLTLSQILNLVEESEAQHQWCGRHGIIGSCSQLLYSDCKKMVEPFFETCHNSIISKQSKDTRIPIDRALNIVEEFRTCTMNDLLRSIDFSRVNPHCFLTLFKAGDQ